VTALLPVAYLLSASPVWYTLWRLEGPVSKRPYWTVYAHVRDCIYVFYRPAAAIQDYPVIGEIYDWQHKGMVKLFGDVPHAFFIMETLDAPRAAE
jgi:hypothetical protein